MWSAAERFGNQIIQFIIGLILARLLVPEDYGLIGMLLVFISVAQVFVDGGFSAALIRKSDPSEEDYSTVFWFNLVVALFIYLIVFFCSPLIAGFYSEPLLSSLAKITGLNIILNAFGIIQKTILAKKLDFKSQAKINVFGILVSGVVGVTCALNGFGVWALVLQNLVKNTFTNIWFWLQSSWRPKVIFSERSFRNLFGFGSKLLASNLINAISENLFTIIIGKLYNAKSLGFYSKANQFQKLPVSGIYGAISAVTYPVLSELKDDKERIRKAYQSMIRLIAFVLFPIMTILGATARPMVKVILTDKWLPCVPLLQILCFIGACYPLHAINLDILKVKGRSDLFLKLEVIKQILNLSMIIICYRFGVLFLLWGLVVLNCICYYLNAFYSKEIIGYGIISQLRDIVGFVCVCLLVLLLLFVLLHMISNDVVLLFVIPVVGVLSYAIFSYFFKIKELFKLKEIFVELAKKLS